ncbi:GNAT family N-acetyltransferase [Micrococcoides hystricis]|uniref:GNAT family N-acetyltransferase n=1 Tax=Micrococcoides hystricis TaxID=1572761 RepID=A0ABV6P911_9MICC
MVDNQPEELEELAHVRSILHFAWEQAIVQEPALLIAHWHELGPYPEILEYSAHPGWFAQAAARHHPEELVLSSMLAALVIPRGGRVLTEELIHTLAEPPEFAFSDSVAVSTDPSLLTQLHAQTPADDAVEVGTADLDHVFVLCTKDGSPLAVAGWKVFQQVVADIRVLVPPALRNKSLGAYAAAVAIGEAYDSGLVPQARVRVGNSTALKLASKLGFRLLGTVSAAFPGEQTGPL